MAVSPVGSITLEQAQELVALLEQGKQREADQIVHAIFDDEQDELFDSVGRLTRQLHDSLREFLHDPRLALLTDEELPDAQNRLEYVMQRTEEAANRTMDAVEASLPLAAEISQEISDIMPVWSGLMSRDIELSQFKDLCHQVDGFIKRSSERSEHLHSLLTEVLMAQDFQDLTGQVIHRVIELVHEVERQLVTLLTIFGDDYQKLVTDREQEQAANHIGPEGPIINPSERSDVVHGQDDVDDLLSSLGF